MKRYRFQAPIQRSTGWGAFVFFPHDTVAEFGTRGRIPVEAQFQGVPYTGSLMPSGTPFHRLAVPQTILRTLGKLPGALLEVRLWRDDSQRTLELPEDSAALLEQERLTASFEALTLTRRRVYRNWITSAKRDTTRRRRVVKAIELLRAELQKTR